MSTMTPTWSFPDSIPGPRTHRPQDFQFGSTPTPLMNQGFNNSAPSSTAAGQNHWNLDNSFYSSLDNLSTEPYSNNLTGLMEQIQFPDAAGNSQRPLSGSQVMTEW